LLRVPSLTYLLLVFNFRFSQIYINRNLKQILKPIFNQTKLKVKLKINLNGNYHQNRSLCDKSLYSPKIIDYLDIIYYYKLRYLIVII